MGPGLAVGGGGLGLAGLVIFLLITLLGGGGELGQLQPLEEQQVGRGDTPSEVSEECRTGEDANERQDCRIVGVVNSVQAFWDGVFQRSGRQYPYRDTVFFTDQVQTECGVASSQVGPFYCPRDQLIYIDLEFFDELQSRFGAGGAPFAQAYVIAHEYGHHVQHLLGADDRVGDDRIQQRSTGRVDRESWTHGSAASRQRWFDAGYRTGDPNRCDTFAARTL